MSIYKDLPGLAKVHPQTLTNTPTNHFAAAFRRGPSTEGSLKSRWARASPKSNSSGAILRRCRLQGVGPRSKNGHHLDQHHFFERSRPNVLSTFPLEDTPAHLHVEGVPRPLPPLAGPVVWHRTGRPRPRATRTERRTAPKAGADGLGSEPRASIQGIQAGKHHCAGGGATHLQMASKKGVQRTRGKVLGVNFSSKNGPLTISILTLKRPKGS